MTPEARARQTIDALLMQAGWHVCNMIDANIYAARCVALRELPRNTGFGFADYLRYIDGRAAGVIEAKKEGATLTGVEVQSARYVPGQLASLPACLGLKPTSPRGWTTSRVPAPCLPFIGPRRWPRSLKQKRQHIHC
jgi:type I site-specific restriction endonuclease